MNAYEYLWAVAESWVLAECGAEGWRVVPGIVKDSPTGSVVLMERGVETGSYL